MVPCFFRKNKLNMYLVVNNIFQKKLFLHPTAPHNSLKNFSAPHLMPHHYFSSAPAPHCTLDFLKNQTFYVNWAFRLLCKVSYLNKIDFWAQIGKMLRNLPKFFPLLKSGWGGIFFNLSAPHPTRTLKIPKIPHLTSARAEMLITSI